MTARHPIDVGAPATGVLSDAWRECVGTGRTGEVLRTDYRDSLAVVQREIGFRYTRAHGIFHDDMGVVGQYEHDGRSGTRYGFTHLDLVVDTWLEAGIAPFLELGFMPSAIASGDTTVFWWKGNVTPPRDEREWTDLVQATLRHLITRYGIDQVRTWPVEVWNEPNLDFFWTGGEDGYHRLYEVTARAVKDVDAELLVGGPAISPGSDEWLPRFADFVGGRDLPCDFVSKHAYTSGPGQEVPFGSYQTFREPRDLLTQFATARELIAGTRLEGLPVHITEFSTSYRPDNPIHDTAHQAAALAPVLVHGGESVASFSYWVLCDVFEEFGPPNGALHGGFGLLGLRQLRKPVFHLYAFMAALGTQVLAVADDHVVTRRADGSVAILAWQPVGGVAATDMSHTVRVDLAGLPARVSVSQRHVDEERGNVRTAWKHLGSPMFPTSSQLDTLHALSEPAGILTGVDTEQGRASVDVRLGHHGIALVEVAPAPDETPAWLDDARLFGLGGEPGGAA